MDMEDVVSGSVAGAMALGYALEKKRQEQLAVDENIDEWERYANSIKSQVRARDLEIAQLKADLKAQSVSTRVMQALYDQIVAEARTKPHVVFQCLDKNARYEFMKNEHEVWSEHGPMIYHVDSVD